MCIFKNKRLMSENELLKQRISILEGQADLCEKLQQQIEDIDNRNTRYLNKNLRLSRSVAAYKFKYGKLKEEDFQAYRNYVSSASKETTTKRTRK